MMISKATFEFLSGLKENNNRDWFEEHREQYEIAKSNFVEFTDLLIAEISKFDDEIREANLEGKKCISRLNRDIRFSKDKTPYKTNFFSIINQGGKKGKFACYYMQLAPGNESFCGGGIYMPPPADLLSIRQQIENNYPEWVKIVESTDFLKVFPEGVESPDYLKRVPRGFFEDSPALEYIKQKGFYTTVSLKDEDLQNGKALDMIVKAFTLAKPMIDFINQAL